MPARRRPAGIVGADGSVAEGIVEAAGRAGILAMTVGTDAGVGLPGRRVVRPASQPASGGMRSIQAVTGKAGFAGFSAAVIISMAALALGEAAAAGILLGVAPVLRGTGPA